MSKYIKITIFLFSILLINGCFNKNQPQKNNSTLSQDSEISQTTTSKAKKVVEITVFSDYACTPCQEAYTNLENLQKKYGAQLKIKNRHYPLNETTFLVAETAECARNQIQFEAYHKALFTNFFGFHDPESLQKIAESTGLNTEAFNLCVQNGITKDRVQKDLDYARNLGIKGAPYFLIDETLPLSGRVPQNTFDRIIRQRLSGEL